MAKLRKLTRRKANNVKLNNKNYNKQLKKGKVKPKSNWSYQSRKSSSNNSLSLGQKQKSDDESEIDVTDMLENDSVPKNSSKRLAEDDAEGDEKTYEKKPRLTKNTNDLVRHLLPIITDRGLVPQLMRMETSDLTPVETAVPLVTEMETVETKFDEEPTTYIGQFIKRQINIKELKERVGLICSSIVENPEDNVHKIRELLNFLENEDPKLYLTCRKITALSLVEVFKDIIPSYRIRSKTEEEKIQKLKKETRILHEYEQSLVKYYRRFLTHLEGWVCAVKSSSLKKQIKNPKAKIDLNLAVLGLKCYSELIQTHPHFNYSSNIIRMLTDRMAHCSAEISKVCCSTLTEVFKNDRVGEISLEAMKYIRKLIKARNYNVPAEVLATFLTLNVRDAIVDKGAKQEEMKRIRQKMLTMSRKEKQRAKKMAELEREMLETQAEENRQKKSKLQTDILENVFIIYFNVLKNSKNKALLTPVMEGLAKFAHLINLDFFNDLINLLYDIIKSNTMSTRQSLHCLKTVFSIFSGQGEALNIDPQGFYVYLYSTLFKLNSSTLDATDCELLFDCLDAMITQRKKKITLQRVLAFAKRLSSLALYVDNRLSIAFLAQIRSILQQHPSADALLETENMGSGIYEDDAEDPEYSKAQATSLFELRYLAHHYQPVIKKYSEHLMLRCPPQGQKGELPVTLSLKTPKELYSFYGKPQSASSL